MATREPWNATQIREAARPDAAGVSDGFLAMQALRQDARRTTRHRARTQTTRPADVRSTKPMADYRLLADHGKTGRLQDDVALLFQAGGRDVAQAIDRH